MSFRNQTFQLNYKLLSYDKSKYENDWTGVSHSHPHSEIIFVTGGGGYFVDHEKKHRISTGSVILTNPYVPHTELSLPAPYDPLEYTVISLGDIYFSSEDEDQLFARSFVYDFGSRFPEFKAHLSRIDAEIGGKKSLWQTAVLTSVNELLILILRLTGLNNMRTEEPLSPKAAEQTVWFVKRYMELYFVRNITLDELADKFFVNKYYLIRAFRQTVGCTPMQYLQKIRVSQAKELLTNTDMSVTQVAVQTGFASASHLAQFFRRYTGETPSAFAKKRGQQEN